MRTSDKTGTASKAVGVILISAGLFAGLPGTAMAQTPGNGGFIDFCDPLSYDNTKGIFTQSFGGFTDLARSTWVPSNEDTIRFRPDWINVYRNLDTTNPLQDSTPKPRKCGLNFFGSTGKISDNRGDMWVTILGTPQAGVQWNQANPPPMNGCWALWATIWFDNSALGGGWNNGKYIGFVTNFDTSTRKGLYFGLYDQGITERLELFSFDVSPTYPDLMWDPHRTSLGGTVLASVNLKVGSIIAAGGGGTTYSYAYRLQLNICTGPDSNGNMIVDATGSVQPSVLSPTNSFYGTCPDDVPQDQQCLKYRGTIPSGIATTGAAGLAAFSPTSGAGFIDVYVADFGYTGGSPNPD